MWGSVGRERLAGGGQGVRRGRRRAAAVQMRGGHGGSWFCKLSISLPHFSAMALRPWRNGLPLLSAARVCDRRSGPCSAQQGGCVTGGVALAQRSRGSV